MIGVLLMAYGGPRSLEEVEPYLTDVRGGRPTPPALLEEVRERYRLIGGASPLLPWTERVASRLQDRLGPAFQVMIGMRHWHPYIAETLAGASVERFYAIPMSPYYSRMSVGAYAEKVAVANVPVRLARSWHLEPSLIEAFAQRVRDAEGDVLFTAHSLPARILQEGDPYPRQLLETARAVAEKAGVLRWHFAYQSPGRTGETWLSPFAEETLDRLHAEGRDRVLVVPVGFLCDHVEILYDLDIALQQHARGLGMTLSRTESLNDSPLLIDALASVVAQMRGAAGAASLEDLLTNSSTP